MWWSLHPKETLVRRYLISGAYTGEAQEATTSKDLEPLKNWS